MDVEAAAGRYLKIGRFAHGFARGKMNGDPVYERVFGRLVPGGTLVDVGCGEGYLLALAVGIMELYGLDHDGRRLDQARQALGEDCTLVEGDVREADLPEADVITCLDVLHYQTPAEQDAIVARLAAALRPGGVLLVRDGASDAGVRSTLTALSERVAVAVGRHKGDGVFLRPRGELEEAMRAAGLTVQVEDCSENTPFANLLYVGTR